MRYLFNPTSNVKEIFQMTKQYISDEEFEALSEKEQVQVLIDMIKDAPHDELLLLKKELDKLK